MTGRNYAITIGINTYSNIRSLDYAQQDAAAMRDYFRDELGFKQVWYFAAAADADDQPTYGTLLRFLDLCAADLQLTAGDNLWFFFAGHGIRYENRDYLLPSDAYLKKVDQTAIPLQYVTEQLTQCGSDNVILLIDACRKRGDRDPGVTGQPYPGVVTFYACSPFESSYEIEKLQTGGIYPCAVGGVAAAGGGELGDGGAAG